MDNATSYILPHDAAPWQSGQLKVFTLGNRVVIFLPANTTSTEQPLDSGIIKAFKAAFRRRHISWIVEQLELDDTDDVSKIKPNMKQAIEWVSYALKEVKVETVVNCWRKAGILPPRETEMDEIDTGISTEDTELLEELSTVVNQMAKTVNVAGESFLSPDKLLDLPIEREIEDNPIDDALHEVQQDPDVDVVEEIEEDPVDNIEPPIITLRDARCHTIFEPFPLSYLRT
ncbi:tigger transposable element-derived protein 6-like [Corticium candelabrum]|uniref:tigger transposable element-derived protein 6-like n=1 Tax=Corticium candelabrum TaxID=121492 RepID=UPI002E253683|nr:tigger transposable element-derived protein 6-like [Corticium candelabrum]